MKTNELSMSYLLEELAMGRLPRTAEPTIIDDPDGGFLAAMDLLKTAGRDGHEDQ